MKVQLLPLKNQKSFDLIFKRGIKYASRFLVISASEIINPQVKITKKNLITDSSFLYTGFKISKKYGKAHERNLLRRRVRSIFYKIAQEKNLPLGVVFIPRSAIKNLEYNDIENQVRHAINWCVKKLSL